MDPDKRIVTVIPLEELWNSEGAVEAYRLGIMSRVEVTNLIKTSKVSFVVANVGQKLEWISTENCYEFWKSHIKDHVVEDLSEIEYDLNPKGFVFVASRWISNNKFPIVTLEKYH